MTAVLDPEKIIHDLDALWDQLENDQSRSGGVLRACSMTLVVAAEDSADAERARQTLGVLMHDHPSRAVVLKPGSDDVSARVFAECWMPFGSAQQICSEGVEITADPSRFEQAAQLIVPLRVPDLPVVLWCRGPGAFSLRAFDALFPLANKIILDSAAVSSAAPAHAFLRSLHRRGYRLADLSWTRLTGWREIVAHLFDEGFVRPPEIVSARVLHSGDTPPAAALYLASWIGQGLPAIHVKVERAKSEVDAGACGIVSVELAAAKDHVVLTLADPSCVEVHGRGQRYRSTLPPIDEEALLSEELNILRPDPVYERVLG